MANREEPSDRSRRKFLKEVGTGIVGAYFATPAINTNAKKESANVVLILLSLLIPLTRPR